MSTKDVVYQLAYYGRDLTAMVSLSASIVLVILGFFHASRGLALRKTAMSISLLGLVAGTALCAVPVERALFLSRLTAIQVLVASVGVWMLSVLIQEYYGK